MEARRYSKKIDCVHGMQTSTRRIMCIRPLSVRPRQLFAAFPVEDHQTTVWRLRNEVDGAREPFGLREDGPLGPIRRQTSATATVRRRPRTDIYHDARGEESQRIT